MNPNYPYTPSAWLYAGTGVEHGRAGGRELVQLRSGRSSPGPSPRRSPSPPGSGPRSRSRASPRRRGRRTRRRSCSSPARPGTGFQFYVAEAALVTGPQTVQTGLVAPLTPVRVTAWWQGRRYPVWSGYAQQWPQEWPDMPQWGFSTLKAADALGAAAAGQMQSALIGEVLIDNPYAYLPCNESYTSQVNGATPGEPVHLLRRLPGARRRERAPGGEPGGRQPGLRHLRGRHRPAGQLPGWR